MFGVSHLPEQSMIPEVCHETKDSSMFRVPPSNFMTFTVRLSLHQSHHLNDRLCSYFKGNLNELKSSTLHFKTADGFLEQEGYA